MFKVTRNDIRKTILFIKIILIHVGLVFSSTVSTEEFQNIDQKIDYVLSYGFSSAANVQCVFEIFKWVLTKSKMGNERRGKILWIFSLSEIIVLILALQTKESTMDSVAVGFIYGITCFFIGEMYSASFNMLSAVCYTTSVFFAISIIDNQWLLGFRSATTKVTLALAVITTCLTLWPVTKEENNGGYTEIELNERDIEAMRNSDNNVDNRGANNGCYFILVLSCLVILFVILVFGLFSMIIHVNSLDSGNCTCSTKEDL